MTFFLGFRTFDPKAGRIRNTPFQPILKIMRRARSVLKNRTSEQIVSVAHSMNWAFEEYERNERTMQQLEAISNLEHMADTYQISDYEIEKFFKYEIDGHPRAGYKRVFKEEMIYQLEINEARSWQGIDALRACIADWDDIGGDDFPNGRPEEYFAVLSLWLIEYAIYCLNGRNVIVHQFSHDNYDVNEYTKKRFLEITDASNSVTEAMEAICESVRLQNEDFLHSNYKNEEESRQQAEKKKRSMQSEKLNIERHRKTNEAKNDVLSEWSKAPSDFPSAEKAGLHFHLWLKEQGRDFEPRTITGWIRAHAKELGIKFR